MQRQLPVDPLGIALGEVFDRIQKTQPVLFAQLVATLHAKLDPELRTIIRIRPDLILVSQGRAQVADEILGSLDTCDAIARHQRQRQQQTLAPLR